MHELEATCSLLGRELREEWDSLPGGGISWAPLVLPQSDSCLGTQIWAACSKAVAFSLSLFMMWIKIIAQSFDLYQCCPTER